MSIGGVFLIFFSDHTLEGDDLLRLVLAVQLEDVSCGQVSLAQARSKRHFQSSAGHRFEIRIQVKEI